MAFHIQVVRKVMRNFTNSFMKHPLDCYSNSITNTMKNNIINQSMDIIDLPFVCLLQKIIQLDKIGEGRY